MVVQTMSCPNTSKLRLRFATMRGTPDRLSVLEMQFDFAPPNGRQGEATASAGGQVSSMPHPFPPPPSSHHHHNISSASRPPAVGFGIGSVPAMMTAPGGGMHSSTGSGSGSGGSDILAALAGLFPGSSPPPASFPPPPHTMPHTSTSHGHPSSGAPMAPLGTIASLPLPMMLETVRIGLLHDIGRLLDAKLHPVMTRLDALDAKVRTLSNQVGEVNARCPPIPPTPPPDSAQQQQDDDSNGATKCDDDAVADESAQPLLGEVMQDDTDIGQNTELPEKQERFHQILTDVEDPAELISVHQQPAITTASTGTSTTTGTTTTATTTTSDDALYNADEDSQVHLADAPAHSEVELAISPDDTACSGPDHVCASQREV